MAENHAVLFVCLGNICRSPLAEAAFRAELQRRGMTLDVQSAGTGGWHQGEPPDRRAIAVARKHGIDIGGYQARKITRADFTRFTHIVALDTDNLATLHALRPPGATAELSLLLDYVPGREGEPVADPWYGDAAGFDITWRDVSDGAAGLANRLFGPA